MSDPMAARSAADALPRCAWARGAPELRSYHDTEWGFPVGDDRTLFEKLCLESFQSGLSWRTILNKRDAFRSAFCDFDIERVARFGDGDVVRLLGDAGIVRHRGKIEAVINNARRAEELISSEGSLAVFAWSFEPGADADDGEVGPPQSMTISPASVAMSKELKRRGWRFVGPTTAFAFMQAMGLLNDHVFDCAIRGPVDDARTAFARPT